MKPLAAEDRTDNLKTTSGHCYGCKDHAVINAETHQYCDAEYEGYAPCPFCLRGHRLEYSDNSPWGADGYWQGRDLPDDVVEAWVNAQNPKAPLPQREQIARIRALSAQLLGTVDAEIAPKAGGWKDAA